MANRVGTNGCGKMVGVSLQYFMFQTLSSYYRTALSDLHYQGVEVLLWRVVVKLLSPVLQVDMQILFDLDLGETAPNRPAKVACVITQAGEEEIDEILDMQMQRLSPEQTALLSNSGELQYAQLLRMRAKAYDTYRRQLRAGERCYVARVDGIMAHSNWVRFDDCAALDTCPVNLKPGEVYTTDGFTRESYRGLRLHEAVATHMLQVAQQRGCRRAYTITDLTKAGSRRGVHRIGWSRRGSILYITPRGLKRTWMVRLGGDLEPLFDNVRASVASDH